jgi:glycosyltransferase involved in cell wall biosynthesis
LNKEIRLKIVGDGPLASKVEQAVRSDPSISWTRHLPLEQVYDTIGDAMFLVTSSSCYETFGRVIVEAYAKGTPVIGPRLGSTADLIIDQETGVLFNAHDAGDLAAKARALAGDHDKRITMRNVARRRFERVFTAEKNHEILLQIYGRALRKMNFDLPAAIAANSHARWN